MDKPIPNKPSSMSDKDYLIKRVSQEYQIPEKTVKVIIDNQFRTAKAALLEVNSLEIAGFGRFYFNIKKGEAKVKKHNLIIKKHKKELTTAYITNERTEYLTGLIASNYKQIKSITEKINHGKSKAPY